MIDDGRSFQHTAEAMGGAFIAFGKDLACLNPFAMIDAGTAEPCGGPGLSATVHACAPEADGFVFASRFTGDACVAVFDRAFGRLGVLGVDELVRHAGFLDALDDYDIVLTEAPV